jgi:hypothetical protein
MKRLLFSFVVAGIFGVLIPQPVEAQVSQGDADLALAAALTNPDVATLLEGHDYMTEYGYYIYSGPIAVDSPTSPLPTQRPTGEIEVKFNFSPSFQYRGFEVAQLRVYVIPDSGRVTSFFMLDSGVKIHPTNGRVVLTEQQEQKAVEIALADPLVSNFLQGKEYKITRVEGMPPWSGSYTGKPGVAMIFTFDKEYGFKGDIYYPPERSEKTYIMDGSVNGLDVMVNLETGQIFNMWPHVSSVPIPMRQLLLYGGVVAICIATGFGIYLYLRRVGYRAS